MLQSLRILAKQPLTVSLLFFSSSPIAVPLFKSLLEDKRFEVQGLVCQPDRPVGRDQVLTAPETKKLALEHGISVFQPEKLRAELDLLASFKKNPPDFLLTFAYGQILSEDWLSLPRLAPLNVHPSLLPLYRGPTPIPASLLNGDKETGLTLMKMVPKMDAGPIAFQHTFAIEEGMNTGGLFDVVGLRAQEWIPDDLLKLMEALEFTEQDESKVSFCSMLSKEDGYLDFALSAEEILRRYRAYTPWPGLWTRCKGERLKLFDLTVGDPIIKLPQGHLAFEHERLYVGTQSAPLEIGSLQAEGKQKLSVGAFLKGQSDFLKNVLPS